MNGNPPASGEICASAFDALLQAIMWSGHLSLKNNSAEKVEESSV